MSEHLSQTIKIFQHITIIFLIIFLQFILVNDFIYADLDQFVGNYLSIYQNAANALRLNGIPSWTTNLFLGGNFLGLQNSYSIYNPFFLITLLFPSRMLAELFIPLLFVKTMLAGGTLYLYMKETKWFSPLTVGVALVLYLFHGWYFSFLNQFTFISLMIYIPFSLYGVEYLFSRGYKRYLVVAITLLLTSHFSFSLLFLPLLFLYWRFRFTYLNNKQVIDPKKQIRFLMFSIGTIVGINLLFILPMILASNTLRLTIEGQLSIASILSTVFRTFTPSFHGSFLGQLSFINPESLGLFQSVLVMLLLPQFIKLIPKPVGLLVMTSYAFLLGLTLTTQTLQIMNVAGMAAFNLNILNLLLLLFNALMVAYVLNDTHHIDCYLLKRTSWGYKFFLTLTVGLAFLYEADFLINMINDPSFSWFKNQVLSFSSYFLIYLAMIILIDIYGYLLKLMADENQSLRRKTMFVIIIIECMMVSSIYFESHSHRSVEISATLTDQNDLGYNVSAVTEHLDATDSNFHRIINSFQVHGNEPLLRNYNGFSTANRYLLNDELAWMRDDNNKDHLSISLADHFLTTALGAKYYLTTDSASQLPGYEYLDRVHGITIFENRYFASVGMTVEYYMLNSDFNLLAPDQQRYVYLQAVILSDDEAEGLVEKFNLQAFDLKMIPDRIGDIQYFAAAGYRQTLGIDDVVYSDHNFSHAYEAKEANLLIYSIPYERGWRATANGKALKIRQVNQGFIGVEIPEAGEFEIVLEYRTPGLRSGFSISMIMLFLVSGHFYKLREEKINSEKGI